MTTENTIGLIIWIIFSAGMVGIVLRSTIFKLREERDMKERNDLNSVEIRGTLDRDVELRHTTNGTPVINLSLVYKFHYNEKEKTSRFDVVQFGPAAEDNVGLLRKDVVVEVFGRLEVASWEDHDGNLRNKVQIVAKNIQIVD